MKMLSGINKIVSILVITTNFAFSNSENFSGVYFSSGYAMNKFSKHVYSNDQIAQLSSDMFYPSFQQHKVSNNIELAYYYPVHKNILIGIGSIYEFNEVNFSTYSNDIEATYKLKDNYSLYLTTLIPFSDNTAMYAKIGNRFSNLSMSGRGPSYAYDTHLSLKGTEHSIGVIHLLPHHLFLKLDLNQYSLKTTDNFGGSERMDFEIKNHSSVLSIGYLFK